MRPGISAQGHEDDVLLASPGNPLAGNDPPGIRKENCLQKYARVIGGRPCLFVLIAIIKDGKIKLVVNEMIQGVLKGAGQDLFLKKDGDELSLGIGVIFVPGHCNLLV